MYICFSSSVSLCRSTRTGKAKETKYSTEFISDVTAHMNRIKKATSVIEKMMSKGMKELDSDKVTEIITLTDAIIAKHADRT